MPMGLKFSTDFLNETREILEGKNPGIYSVWRTNDEERMDYNHIVDADSVAHAKRKMKELVPEGKVRSARKLDPHDPDEYKPSAEDIKQMRVHGHYEYDNGT